MNNFNIVNILCIFMVIVENSYFLKQLCIQRVFKGVFLFVCVRIVINCIYLFDMKWGFCYYDCLFYEIYVYGRLGFFEYEGVFKEIKVELKEMLYVKRGRYLLWF